MWPPSGYNAVNNQFEIKTGYVWQNALAMVAPGGSGGPVKFGTFSLPGYTRQLILF